MQNEIRNFRNEINRDPASFRDPASNVYTGDDFIAREIYPRYFKEYDHFMAEIYPELKESGLIIEHKEMSRTEDRIIITPDLVEFISYPYEWNFEQLKAAALATLAVNFTALKHNMILKDASAYNIQFHKDHWRLIDTCSFMEYSGDTPWPAYGQFLRHFLNPLLLMKYVHSAENRLSQIHIDGIPTPYTANRLPFHCHLYPKIWTHTYIQSWSDLFKEINPKRTVHMSRIQLIAFLENLAHLIIGLKYKPYLDRGWIKYAEAGSYTPDSLKSKKEIIKGILAGDKGRRILDLGANTGDYSRIAANQGYDVIAVDSDHDCMFALNGKLDVLPLIVDLCNPPPAIGWANTERRSFWDRIGKVDCILALAVIHHLCIRNNVPLGLVADLLADHTNRYLVIEWIPPDDKQAVKLRGSKNIPEYDLATFIQEFSRRFNIDPAYTIDGSTRRIFVMEIKDNGVR